MRLSMKPIEESMVTKAPAKRVWKAWVDMYVARSGGKAIFKDGYKGYVIEQGRKVPFQLVDIVKGEGFTTIWKSFFVKMIFRYEVKQQAKGSLITASVKFGGSFGWVARFFLKSKMRKNLSKSLEQFVSQSDMTQPKIQIRGF
jgi:hypothetical protein